MLSAFLWATGCICAAVWTAADDAPAWCAIVWIAISIIGGWGVISSSPKRGEVQ